MIGTIDVNVQAAKPGFPLAPVRAFVSSPSSLRIRNVPRRIGEWEITSVRVSVDYPDGTTASVDCVQIAGVWVGTIRGCAVPGNALRGFRVTADGVDERGEDVTGYVLGVGDVEILNRENAVTPETQTFKGDPGADGDTPVIGENGNWWIGGVDTGKPARGPQGKPGDVPVLSTTFTAQDAGKAADAKAVGDKIADDMTKVTTLKINDEWRFSVAPGLSGDMAIRLEHLDFPAQGIWGVYTEMSIPTGLGTLAKSAEIPKISTTFAEQDAGKAADAKAVGEKFAEQFGHISSIGNMASNADEKADAAIQQAQGKLDSGEAILEKDAYGLTDESRVAGFFVRKNGGIFIGTAGGIVEIPYLRPGTMALDVDIADAVKLTPVWSFSNVSEELKAKMPFTMRYGEDWGWNVFGSDGNAIDGVPSSKSDTVVDFAVGKSATNSGIIATIIGYTTANGENLMSGTDDAKTALFAGEAFREAAFGKAATSAANLESGNVAVVDGSAGGTVTVSFKANATGDNSLRYCELLVTGVTADDAVTISLPAGTYQFADGADKTSKGNNHFVFAEYAGGWMVNKTVRTEATITEG